MARIQYNERSWAIDLISEINSFTSKYRRTIHRAGGEATIRNSTKVLFPDVLLYGPASNILMGWELKLPDTAITDRAFIENAESKAMLLGLNSFLLWNAKVAVLYIKEGDNFNPAKTWNNCENIITDRSLVEAKKDEWVKQVHVILKDINDFFDDGTIRQKNFVQSFRDSEIIELILRNRSGVSEQLKVKARRNSSFAAEINIWWRTSKLNYPNTDQWDILAQIILVNWINKFLFAHILTGFFDQAKSVKEIDNSTSIINASEVFQELSKKCDFWNVFQSQLGEDSLTENAWAEITELNGLLGDIEISSIGHELLQDLLENLIYSTKRKVAGQYSTSPDLSRFLVNLTMTNKEGVLHDPCCGTGTIARAAYNVKREVGLTAGEALKTTLASDKVAFPLQMATIALSEPQNIGEILRIFQKDCTDLEIGDAIEIRNPFTGELINQKYEKVDFIASNLPFVQQEDLDVLNPNINKNTNDLIKGLTGQEIELTSKSDLYAYLPFYLWRLLKEGGRLGIITSNSWLGTDWGDGFRELLNTFFHIDVVAISGKDRWFHNSDVITTILILNKRASIGMIDDSEQSKFITVNLPLSIKTNVIDGLVDDLIAENQTGTATIRKYSSNYLKNFPLNWTALFSDISWLDEIKGKTLHIGDFFSIARGERRGWDKLFYPGAGHGIEAEFIKPVLKTPRDIKQLEVSADSEAFCCSKTREELKSLGYSGALRWISRFEHEFNTRGEPLPVTLKRSGIHWYEMSPNTIADLVASINYGERIFIARLKHRAFVNQRLIRLTVKGKDIDIDLMHALLNTSLSYFFIESLGFGRGLGALDLHSTKLNDLQVLNPRLLSKKQGQSIKNQFSKLKERNIMPLLDELEDEDRNLFDQIVFEAYGITEKKQEIVSSLKFLHQLRSRE